MALPTWQSGGYDGPQAADYLRQVAASGARWVEVVPTWYQANSTASDIHRTASTASDRGVERMIALAHQDGLHVLLKPHVDMTGLNGRWVFQPDHPLAWFASFRAFITHYALLAARSGVDEFSVGTELYGIDEDRQDWLTVIAAVRAEYHGPLVYAAGNDEYTKVAFWDALDIIGIDAWWPLSRVPTSDPAVLEESWRPILAQLETFSAHQHKRVLFTEAGYTSQSDTVTAPGNFQLPGAPDQAEQAAAYQALLDVFTGKPWWAGVMWWVWGVLPSESQTSWELGYSIYGKQAAAVVRKWWQ